MKRFTAIVFITICYSQVLFAQNESGAKPITVSGNIQVTNNGTAPVPIFALGRPAAIGSIVIKKGNFYFNPELYFGLDAKPWMANNRFGYNFIDNKKLTLGYASNVSFFYLQRNPSLNNNEEFQLQRYWANEIDGEFRIKEHRKIQFNYWHSICLDKLGIQREEFVNIIYAIENIKIGTNGLLSIRPSAFYLLDAAALEGVFVSQTSNFQLSKWKYNFFIQTAIPVHVSPHNSFIWNFGINVPF